MLSASPYPGCPPMIRPAAGPGNALSCHKDVTNRATQCARVNLETAHRHRCGPAPRVYRQAGASVTQTRLASLAKQSTMARREAYWFYGLISPWALGFLLFTAYPVVSSIILSLSRWDLIHPAVWVGLGNYREALTDDPLFWQSLKVTAIYTFGSVPIRLAAGLAVAILMNQKIPAMPFFRTIWYLPSVVSGVAVAVLWLWILNPYYGLLNYAIWLVFRVQGPFWLAKEELVLPAFILMSMWSVGGGMVIVLAALQGVPTELYEASEIDGAGRWSKF